MKKILLTTLLLVSGAFALENFSANEYQISSDSVSLAANNVNYAEFKYKKGGKLYSRVVDYEELKRLKGFMIKNMSKREVLKNHLVNGFDNAYYVVARGQVAVHLKSEKGGSFEIVGFENERDYKRHNILPYLNYLSYYKSKNKCIKEDKKYINKFYNIVNGNFSQFEINGDRIDIVISYSLHDYDYWYTYYKTKSACEKDL